MENNLGRDCVFPDQVSPPRLVKTEATPPSEPDECLKIFVKSFTTCAVRSEMARAQVAQPSEVSKNTSAQVFMPQFPAPLSRHDNVVAQKNHQSLQKYFALTANDKNLDHGYFVHGYFVRR